MSAKDDALQQALAEIMVEHLVEAADQASLIGALLNTNPRLKPGPANTIALMLIAAGNARDHGAPRQAIELTLALVLDALEAGYIKAAQRPEGPTS